MYLPSIFRRSNWKNIIKQQCWKHLSPSWSLQSGVKIHLESSSDWITFGDLFLNGEYDKSIDNFLSESIADSYVIDLGANVGFFAQRVVHMMAKRMVESNIDYIGVEPNPFCRAKFNERVLGGSEKLNIQLIPGIVGQLKGSAAFATNDFHISSRVSMNSNQFIDYVNLNDYVSPGKIIGLLKIDIEGSEQDFLENYQNLIRRSRNLVIEFHGNLCDVAKCRSIISNCGFESVERKQVTTHYELETFRATTRIV